MDECHIWEGPEPHSSIVPSCSDEERYLDVKMLYSGISKQILSQNIPSNYVPSGDLSLSGDPKPKNFYKD
jgi:hypothetical protein